MASVISLPDVLTLDELAEYLRLPGDVVRKFVAGKLIPGQQIGEEWRFSRRAIEDWLRGPSANQALLFQAGAFKDDADDLRQMVRDIYGERGRPESDLKD
jgi:excisionase family DNA binding protein